MKLRKKKTKTQHYFKDKCGLIQGKFKTWHKNGQKCRICHYRDNELHGEFKSWYSNGNQWEMSHFRDGQFHGERKYWGSSGKLIDHTFDVNGEEIIDFLEKPELYPETPEEKLMFVLKYGNAPFIKESLD